jgi:methionine-rich copper-binding protein CopC
MMRKKIMLALIGLSAASLLGASANAHPTLISSNPQANVPAGSSPTEIRLSFTERVIAKFSGVELKDESGKPVATGAATVDPKDRKQLVVPIATPLAAGSYTVVWHAVSEDTHRVTGQYTFKVELKPEAGSAPSH